MQTNPEKRGPGPLWLILACGLGTATWLQAATPSPSRLTVRLLEDAVELEWPAHLDASQGGFRPIFEVQQSPDLKQWSPVGSRIDARRLATSQPCRLRLAATGPGAFYRFAAFPPTPETGLGSGGENVFGFGAAFAEALSRVGQLSPTEFAARYPSGADYLPEITWDPTDARYWDLFSVDPEVFNVGRDWDDADYRKNDFRLDDRERAVFRKHGFVVSERLGTYSFADAFYRIWEDDLPVFISCDAILQAWHRSFDMILRELEVIYLRENLQRMLDAMAAGLPAAANEAPARFPPECLKDADYFLTVARSLLAGKSVTSSLGTDARVVETLAWIDEEELRCVGDFFGSCRVVDFSQFKPRGHYTETPELSQYFRAMMWCGRTDVVVAGGPYSRCFGNLIESAPPRELGIAIVLWHLLKESGEFETWRSSDRVIQAFVGWTDSLTFAQLGGLLRGAGIESLADVPGVETLQAVQAAILAGELGTQLIRSDCYVSPFGPEQILLPRTFTVLGQKFVPDSWATANLVFDSILWEEDGCIGKVNRRVPSALDVAFAVLGNNQIVPELVARMTDVNARSSSDHAVRFRDGMPYQHNLAAVREVMGQLSPEAWQKSIFMDWLATLRALSAPTTDAAYPDAMRTRAWALKTLNTQLASWTHLRHDTILYAKQSYTAVGRCYFPEGFVEARPRFWASLRQMAVRAAALIGELSMNEGVRVDQQNQVAFLGYFADTAAMLEQLSEAELAGRTFRAEEELFIRNMVEQVGWTTAGSTGLRVYDGWYPRLFYRGHAGEAAGPTFHLDMGCDRQDLVVADVHTDPPDEGDPGSVLHQGVGNVLLLMLAVRTPTGPAVFAGPVLSHYEFELVGPPRRLSDEDWKEWFLWSTWGECSDWLDEPAFPDHPEWTRSYLVPCPR